MAHNTSLDGFELELHHFAADDVAEVILPKAAEARKVVDQEFESEPAPERKQAHVHSEFTKARGRIIIVAAVIGPEIAEREAVEMPAMRGIAERAEVGVMRSDDEDAAGRRDDAVKLLHGADDIGYMLDDMHGAKRCERVVAERVRETVEVADDVGPAARIAIDAD